MTAQTLQWTARQELPQRVVDMALQLGEARGWNALNLHELARELGVSLTALHAHFPDKDAIAEAWFDRADLAMLALPTSPGWEHVPADARLHRALCAWFAALAPHRRLAREMLGYKLQPEHLHLQLAGARRVSRTVQWWREAAWLPSTGWRRELEELALTAIYLATFAHWLRDDSAGFERTRVLLERLLSQARRGAQRLSPAG